MSDETARQEFDRRFGDYSGYRSEARQDDLFRVFQSGMQYADQLAADRALAARTAALDPLHTPDQTQEKP